MKISSNGSLGLHIINTPSGRYTFVGSIPAHLVETVRATKADVMGGRAWRNEDGEVVTARVPTFSSYQEAMNYVAFMDKKPGATPCIDI
jgi:hypothetical protein